LIKAHSNPLKGKFLFEWIVATTIAWTIINLAQTYSTVSPLCLLPLIGFAQWYVLEYYQPHVRWWIWTSALGVGISGFIIVAFSLVGLGLNILSHPLFAGTITGASVGILQWLFLRRLSFRAAWWILASVVSLISGGSVRLIIETLFSSLVGAVLGGLVVGGISGLALIWLFEERL
jgi:hypothetical protein